MTAFDHSDHKFAPETPFTEKELELLSDFIGEVVEALDDAVKVFLQKKTHLFRMPPSHIVANGLVNGSFNFVSMTLDRLLDSDECKIVSIEKFAAETIRELKAK